MARDEGWLAEHMLILKLTSPEGEVEYITGAFPSACGKTNLAMLIPTLEGWTVKTDRRRYCLDEVRQGRPAVRDQPRGRLLRRRARHGFQTNPNAMKSIEANTIFTNCALTDDGDVWWEGMTPDAPEHLTDWHGTDWTPSSDAPAAHPNARFTVPAAQCPVIADEWNDPPAYRSTPFYSAVAARCSRPCARRLTGSTGYSSARR